MEVKRSLTRLERLLLEDDYQVVAVDQKDDEYWIRLKTKEGHENTVKKAKDDMLVLVQLLQGEREEVSTMCMEFEVTQASETLL